MRDPWDTPEMKRWARAVNEEMLPKLQDSHVSMPLWTGSIDVKFAVEVGASVLLDKPILLLVMPGVQVPDKLVRVADEIVEADPNTEQGRQRMGEKVQEFLRRVTDG